jgi:hypothetical protein
MSSPIVYRIPVKQKKPELELPPEVNTLRDLIEMAHTGKKYENINTEMLWRISAQLIDIDDMVGMEKLKKSILFHVVYYLMEMHVNDERDYMHTLITGPPGSGKCLAKGTNILKFDGKKINVENVEIGDLLMGDDSTSREVLSVCQGREKLVKIIQPNSSYTVNKSHILSVFDRETNEFKDIPIEEFQSHYLGYRRSVHFEQSVELGMDPYTFGYCMFKKILHERYINHPNSRVVGLATTEFEYCYDISQLPEIYRECILNRTLPPDFIFFSHDQLKAILEGIIDAVGGKDFYTDNIYTNLDIIMLCNIIGVKYTTLTKRFSFGEETMIYYVIRIPDMECYDVVTYPIKLEFLDEGEYYGFELSGNGRFMLGDCTVTHNTTIARIIGEMYKNMGVLSADGVFKIAKREDLVAEYLGQTAVKTKKLLESCLGGVLFIDEVYALGPGKKDSDSFSKEAIDTLNVFLSENSDNFCCIIAGYEEEVNQCFFSVNQGLERRFQWIHRIEEYDTKQLAQMFIKLMGEIRWKRDQNLTEDVIVKTLKENKLMFKSFGGDIENLISKCKMAHAMRIINQPNPEKHVITIQDLKSAIELMKPNKLKVEKEEDMSYLRMFL